MIVFFCYIIVYWFMLKIFFLRMLKKILSTYVCISGGARKNGLGEPLNYEKKNYGTNVNWNNF